MSRAAHRIRILDDGSLEIIDPGYESVGLLRELDPDFSIRSNSLPGFASPRFLQLRNCGGGIVREELGILSEDELWDAHDRVMKSSLRFEAQPSISDSCASVLELKAELAYRMLSDCRLCVRRCGVDRTAGGVGVCGLGVEAYVGEHFVHIAEESPVNPSLVLNLKGCALRCIFCQQHSLLNVNAPGRRVLDGSLWGELDTTGARSLSFVGGNPDESLYAILRFLAAAPEDWSLPVVWNCHGYATREVLKLLNGVVDAYIPDLKYMSDGCARRLSQASGYTDAVKTSIREMLAQKVPVYVRILILPGHFGCCHLPALEFLADFEAADNLYVSVRGQYCPDWKSLETVGPLSRRPTAEEVYLVLDMARGLGLAVVDETGSM